MKQKKEKQHLIKQNKTFRKSFKPVKKKKATLSSYQNDIVLVTIIKSLLNKVSVKALKKEIKTLPGTCTLVLFTGLVAILVWTVYNKLTFHAETSLTNAEASIANNSSDTSVPAALSSNYSALSTQRKTELKKEIQNIKQSINDQGGFWTADYTNEFLKSAAERKNLLGVLPPSQDVIDKAISREETFNADQTVADITSVNLPGSFDWRNTQGKNYITPVKDQGQCGSCWAFAAAASLEGSINTYYNKADINADLSEQDLISCYHGQGCEGATDVQIEQIFSLYYQNNGIAPESCYPYSATNGNCADKCSAWKNQVWKTGGYVKPDLTVKDIKQALVQNGPVEVGMAVYNDFFAYSSGIYKHNANSGLAGYHAVTIVGYGSSDGINYWIVKNSWGTNWGESGYFKIAMGDSMINSWYAFAPQKPISQTAITRQCTDSDKDGYCNWGAGEKPSSGCPPCNNTIRDCDDNNPKVYINCNKADPTGKLSVASTPIGASVFVKDPTSGQFILRGKTPLTINLNPGTRDVKITKDKYLDYSQSINITVGQKKEINATLVIAPGLTSPLNNDIFRKGDNVPIQGVYGANTSNAKIEYSQGNSGKWQSSGVKMDKFTPSKNTTPIRLAQLDTGALPASDYYTIRLSSTQSDGSVIYKYIDNFFADSSLRSGWPVHMSWEKKSNSNAQVNPSLKAYTYFPNSSDGSSSAPVTLKGQELSQLPDKIKAVSEGDTYWWAGILEPVVADINNDGNKEIIVHKFSTYYTPPKLQIYKVNGDLLCEKKFEESSDTYYVGYDTPVVGDINNDGKQEIVISNQYTNTIYNKGISKIYALDGNCNVLPNWPVSVANSFAASYLITNPDTKSKSSIGSLIIMKDNEVFMDYAGRHMTILDGQGKIISHFNINDKSWDSVKESAPAVGDFDNDGQLEIVTADPSPEAGYNNDQWINSSDIYVYKMNGTVLKGWPVKIKGIIFSSPVVGDVNNDGSEEVVVGATYTTKDGMVDKNYGGLYVFNKQGKLLPGWPKQMGNQFLATPALGDIDGDGKLEIAANGMDNNSYLYRYDGALMPGWPKPISWTSISSSLMGDINNDNKLDIVTTAGNGFVPILNDGGVYGWAKDGQVIKGFPKVTENNSKASAVIDDIDNDGLAEIVASSDWDYDFTNNVPKYRGSLYVWKTNYKYQKSLMPWPCYMHDPQHTGRYTK